MSLDSSKLSNYEKALKLSSVAAASSLFPDSSSDGDGDGDGDDDAKLPEENAHGKREGDQTDTHNEKALRGGAEGEGWAPDLIASEFMELKMTADEEIQELTMCSESERIQAATDLYGATPCATDLDKLLDSMERELSQIPTEKKSALLQARSAFPLIFSVPSHSKMFLKAEGYDPKRAAERMVRYWEKRVHFYGDNAFSQEAFQRATPGDEADYLRHYARSKELLEDEGTDEEMRQIANEYVMQWEHFKIVDLDRAVEGIPLHERMSLDQAQKARPDLAASREHKLLFLQSADFDVQSAAQKMVNYWDTAVALFGAEVAFFHQVTVASLMEEHSHELSMGLVSLCPGTDAGGRAVICMRPAVLGVGGYSHDGLMKAVWYVFHVALQMKSARVHGAVIVTAWKGQTFKNIDLVFRKKIMRLIFQAMPLKICFVHTCVSPSAQSWLFFKIVYPIGKALLGRKMRLRLWLHRGTDQSISNELRDCGLSNNQIPAEFGGEATSESCSDWFKGRMADGL